MSDKKQEVLAVRKHGIIPIFGGVHHFSILCVFFVLLFFVDLFLFLLYLARYKLPVSLESPFLISNSVFSNV